MKLIIFDCDGTLVDSQHAIVAAMNKAFAAEGLWPPARSAVLGVVGLSLTSATLRLLPRPDRDLAETIANHYKSAFAELRSRPEHEEPMFPGARQAIEKLTARGDVVLGIATGKSRRGVDAFLERERLAPYFTTIQTADNHPSKPHPSMIMVAMAEAGAEPERTVMVGDTSFDVEMARSAEVAALGVSWGYHPARELVQAGAHLVIDDYAALEPAVDRLLAEAEVR